MERALVRLKVLWINDRINGASNQVHRRFETMFYKIKIYRTQFPDSLCQFSSVYRSNLMAKYNTVFPQTGGPLP